MNKHELKSLLENIYHLLAEAAPPPPPQSPGQWTPESPGLYIPGYRGFVPFHLPTPPVATPVPTVPNERIRPQLLDYPALMAEINRIRAEIRRILRLPPENQEGLEALKAQLNALIAEYLRRQQLQRDARKPFWS